MRWWEWERDIHALKWLIQETKRKWRKKISVKNLLIPGLPFWLSCCKYYKVPGSFLKIEYYYQVKSKLKI